MRYKSLLLFCLIATLSLPALLGQQIGREAIIAEQFVPTPSVARWRGQPAIEITRNEVAVVWCEGSAPEAADTEIWMAKWVNGQWKVLGRVATGYDERRDVRYPCSSPVLFQDHDGRLWLFYQVGDHRQGRRTAVRMSFDGGQTWKKFIWLPSGIYGPTDNRPVQLNDGTFVCPTCDTQAGWRVRVDWAKDPDDIWYHTGYITSAFSLPCGSPAIIQHDERTFQLLMSTKTGRIATAWSRNGWKRWNPPERTPLPCPGTGIAASWLLDHRIVLAFNNSPQQKDRMDIAISPDGQSWRLACELEQVRAGELIDPDIIEGPGRKIHVVYGWNGIRIRHFILESDRLSGMLISAASADRGDK